jgi:uncharacterized protein
MPDVIVERDIRVPTAVPGLTLSADVVRPGGPDPVAALVTVLPYRTDAAGGLMLASELDWFAEQGYACVLADLRGIGSSDGDARPPFDADEADDGVAVVEWAAAQPWCSGRVGMWGHSYGGLMTLRTAARRPRALRAILPMMALTDPERDFTHPYGVRGGLGAAPTWGATMLLSQLLPPLTDNPFDARQQRRWKQRLDAEPWLVDLLRRPAGDPDWRRRAVDVSRIDVPTFCVAGWRDLFCDATIRAYERIRTAKKLLVGPWMHTVPHFAPETPVDFRALALRWWRHWLDENDTGYMDEPAVTAYIQSSSGPGRWWALPEWPPSDAVMQSWRADARRSLTEPSDNSGHASAQPDDEVPADPTVGSAAGLVNLPSGFGGPLDQHDDDLRSIRYTTNPLDHELILVGHPEVVIDFEGRPERVVVRLLDIGQDGRSHLVTSGVAAVEHSSPATSVTVPLVPTAYHFAAGTRIGLAVGLADFPRLWPANHAGDGVRVRRLSLRMPSASKGTVVEPAPPQPSVPVLVQLMRSGGGSWTVARDHLNQTLEVGTSEAAETATRSGGHVLSIESKRAAVVSLLAPDSATMTTSAQAKVVTSQGTTVEVAVQLEMRSDSWSLSATVDQDGDELMRRAWCSPSGERTSHQVSRA